MRVRVFKVFGREVLRVETHEEVTVSDVVAAMLAHRQALDEEECEEEAEEDDCCEYCGEPLTEDDIIAARFSTMTERLVWDARTEEEDED